MIPQSQSQRDLQLKKKRKKESLMVWTRKIRDNDISFLTLCILNIWKQVSALVGDANNKNKHGDAMMAPLYFAILFTNKKSSQISPPFLCDIGF